MSEIWKLLVIGYMIITGASLIMVTIKLLIPQYIFSIDEICTNKYQVCDCVINYIQEDLGVTVHNLTIDFDYEPNDEFSGSYLQETHTVTLYHHNLDNVHSWILTLVEEIHHAIFLSTRQTMKTYHAYDKKVGYGNNPLECAAKVYALNNFRSIHRVLKNRGLIRYRV
jgi:hypothetical protein